MTVTFDPSKRLVTLRERGIDFATDAEKVFAGHVVVHDRFQYGEVRNINAGYLDDRMVVIAGPSVATIAM